MRTYVRAIDLNALTRSVEVDNRMSLAFYYRLADNLLKQARIYREEKNLIDLYIILLRYSSLLCETIPSHHEYQTLPPIFKKKLLDVMNELESLKPEVLRQVGQLNREHTLESSTQKRISNSSAPNRQSPLNSHIEQAPVSTSLSAWRSSNETNQIVSPDNLRTERSIHKISFGIVNPKEETLSRHSILGPHGLRGNNAGPISGIRVQYPSNFESIQSGSTTRNQSGESSSTVTNERDPKKNNYDLESLLSLDDGQWSIPVEESGSFLKSAVEEDFNHLNIRQPCPPPVLAQVQPEPRVISPNKIADPRPGPAKPSQDGTKAFQDLHVPVKIMESFLRLAEKNTAKNLETCGILAGSLKNRVFFVTTLIIPKQESTSDSCQTTDEEEIFNVQDKLSLFPLGWIHTHPTQTCFMSSIDLHTHYSYQAAMFCRAIDNYLQKSTTFHFPLHKPIFCELEGRSHSAIAPFMSLLPGNFSLKIMLPEAIAIVMAPTDTSRTHGIFHLSDPSGVNLIRNCQERGFHPHEEPLDGSPIYEHCSHVYMNPNLKYDVIDLRKL